MTLRTSETGQRVCALKPREDCEVARKNRVMSGARRIDGAYNERMTPNTAVPSEPELLASQLVLRGMVGRSVTAARQQVITEREIP